MGRTQAQIQEELFAEWQEMELLVGINTEDAIKTIYNAYQGAMSKLTKMQKKRVNEEERQYRISLVIALVSKRITITAPIYMKIINTCRLGKNFSEESVANVVVNQVLNEQKKRLKRREAKRIIKL